MKKTITNPFVILLFMLCVSCQSEMHDSQKGAADLVFNAGVGEPIPVSTAARWIENYNKEVAGARDAQIYTVTQSTLQAMMGSTSGLVGFAFHHALDNAGMHHILIIPIDNTIALWGSQSQRVLVDANTDTEVDLNTAQRWADNYTTAYPGAIRYHFFGADIFHEIVENPEFRIEEALSDEQVPQLLLVVQKSVESSNSGRTELEEQVYDASFRCPACCMN